MGKNGVNGIRKIIIFIFLNSIIVTDQIKLLNNLARKIKSEEKTKEQAMRTLVAAKILKKTEN